MHVRVCVCKSSMHVCECLWASKRRWVREWSSISPRTGLWMVIIAGWDQLP